MRTLLAFAIVAAAFAPGARAQDKAKEEIDAKLRNLRITLDFKEAPIDSVIDYIREISGLNIFLDGKVREKNLMVTLKVSDITLGSVMTLMLSPHGAGTLYREGVLMIMDKPDILDKTIRSQIYDCRDILHPIQDFPGVDLQIASDGLGVVTQDGGVIERGDVPIEELVKTHTGGKSWDENQKCVCSLQNGLLIVKNTPEVHKQVKRLLDMLRRNK